ncbi:MAG: OmpA family protein [Clostridiales bacterium]|nr:OmpA family protein [Clostridiales bacterium]
MKKKYYHSIWNYINTTAISFLALLIISLLFLSAFLNVNEDEPANGVILTNSELKEKEEQLINLEHSLQEKEEELNRRENQASVQEASKNELIEGHTNIIDALLVQFSEFNQQLHIDDQTGSIRLGDGYLFESSESDITEEGANYLKEFVPIWLTILLNEENRDYIAEIIIEGHGDDQGTYLSNLNLSQRRASEVARYILSEEMPNFEYKEQAAGYITANGKSFSQPVVIDGNIDKEKSRRVEFKFRLKDEMLTNDIRKIIDERTDS